MPTILGEPSCIYVSCAFGLNRGGGYGAAGGKGIIGPGGGGTKEPITSFRTADRMVDAPHVFLSSRGTVCATGGFLNSFKIKSSLSLVIPLSKPGSRVNNDSKSSDAKIRVCTLESSLTNSSSNVVYWLVEAGGSRTTGSAERVSSTTTGSSKSIGS